DAAGRREAPDPQTDRQPCRKAAPPDRHEAQRHPHSTQPDLRRLDSDCGSRRTEEAAHPAGSLDCGAGEVSVKADPLRARGSDVAALIDTLRRGGSALESVPHQIKQILRDETWRHFVTRLGKEVRHERFADFVTTPPLAGLGSDRETVRKLLVDDAEALDLFDKAYQNQPGRPSKGSAENLNNIKGFYPRGTSKDYALRKLRKDAPELHAEVLAGRLSAHAAMVKAGFRPPAFTVRADSPQSVAATLRRRLPPDVLAEVARLLMEG